MSFSSKSSENNCIWKCSTLPILSEKWIFYLLRDHATLIGGEFQNTESPTLIINGRDAVSYILCITFITNGAFPIEIEPVPSRKSLDPENIQHSQEIQILETPKTGRSEFSEILQRTKERLERIYAIPTTQDQNNPNSGGD